MKSSSASRGLLRALALALLFAGGGVARAADLERGFQCLAWTDLPCAVEEAKGADGTVTGTLLQARVAFHQGDFEQAVALSGSVLDRAAEVDLEAVDPVVPPRIGLDLESLSGGRLARYRSIGVEIPQAGGDEPPKVTLQQDRSPEEDFELLRAWMEEQHGLYLASLESSDGLVVTQYGPVEVLHHPGIERILVLQAAEAITLARERIAPLLGGPVPGTVRVEIYPDRSDFIAATGMPAGSVNTTGVVAISKWNRLLLLSPRALGDGYGWRDTLVHEWIHMVVSYHAKDRAPIWLQEGLAKGTEMLWRQDGFSLEISKQSLLAGALKTDQWVTFEQMHPSMAYLPSAEMAGLAYAEVATMVEYLQLQTDRQVLTRVIARVRKGEDAQDAVANEANGGDFQAFWEGWKGWLRTLDLVGEKVALSAVGEHMEGAPDAIGGEGSEDVGYDPVLSRRKDLANRARLGELMAEQGDHAAAILYFQEAMPEGEPASPAVVASLAESLIVLEREQEALDLLRENLRYYPEESRTQTLAGDLLSKRGQTEQALAAYEAAAEVNPFDVHVQRSLMGLYKQSGAREDAAATALVLDILTYRELDSSVESR
ncbi:MAG: hypothetical protein VX899_19465 [Myxococcota bacterium]|nr:hypothetical protein [Myxococcota bacterium]